MAMAIAIAIGLLLLGQRGPALAAEPAVELRNLQTGARLLLRESHLPAPLVLNRFLQCPVEQRYTLMDPRLVLWAAEAARHFGAHRIEIVSAFRTAGLVRAQAAEGKHVALRSRHINGQALDVRLPGISTDQLCAHFLARGLGGVGCYRRAGFVHIDVGPRRSWSG